MRCLVTGGLGFIGSHIVNRLHGLGHDVTIVDDCSSPCDQPIPASAMKCPGSISDRTFLSEQVRYYGQGAYYRDVQVVFNTAAIARTVPCISDPLRCHDVNATGALNIFAAFYEARIVHCSSNVVLGVHTPYRASKLAAENHLEALNELKNANIIGLRFSNVIGSHLRKGDGAVLSMLRDCRAEHGYVEVTGDGTQTRNFTSVTDIVDACMIAAFDSEHKGIVDVTSGRVTSMNEFAAFFKCPIKYIGERKGDTPHIHQSPEDAKRILGWSAKVTLEEEMERCLS